MVKLTPDQQAELPRAAPEIFHPAAAAWGRSGSTIVRLSSTGLVMLRPLMRQAWENARTSPAVRKRRPRR